MNVLHIGMGKTGSTSLQTHVFPRLPGFGVVGAYNPPELCRALDGAVNGYVPEAEVRPLAATQSDMLLSNETLIEWDPALWEAAADRLLRIFGPDTMIVITVRDPKSYLRSLYQQTLHAGKIRPPHEFFLSAHAYHAVRRFLRPGEMEAIDVDAFDMRRMVRFYTERFRQVLLVAFDGIGDLRFLPVLWPGMADRRAQLADAFARVPHANRSYGALAVRLTLGRERGLAAMGLRSLSATDTQRHKAMAHATSAVPVLGKPLRRPSIPSWYRLMSLLSRCGVGGRYTLPPGLYLGQHLAANMAFYEEVRTAADGCVLLRQEANVHHVRPVSGQDRPAPRLSPEAMDLLCS